jgi:type I restriction enzyme S subunit
MKTPKARERLVSGGSGANISNLNQRILGEFPVMLPSIVRQRAICRQIAEAIETRSDVRARYEATVSDMDALRQSLLHKAFSGQLT